MAVRILNNLEFKRRENYITVGVRMSRRERDMLERLSRKNNSTMSEIIRALVREAAVSG